MRNKVFSFTSMLGRHAMSLGSQANEELSPRILWGIMPRITLTLTARQCPSYSQIRYRESYSSPETVD